MTPFYSVRMRASRQSTHISGAERLTSHTEDIPGIATSLVTRGFTHELGTPDSLTLTCEQVASPPRLLDPLAVQEHAGPECIPELLSGLPESGWEVVTSPETMRGAALIDIATGRRVEPNHERGVRVTHMDWAELTHGVQAKATKDHFREALVLATKTLSCPGIVAELCVSDDTSYTTGYIARDGVYHRIPRIAPGARGGRAFFVDLTQASVEQIIAYLEHEPVLVRTPPPQLTSLTDELHSRNKTWRSSGLSRSEHVFTTGQDTECIVDGKNYTLFSSSNYLGLATHPEVVRASTDALHRYGAGSGGSRLTTGTTHLHTRLEEELASWLGYPDCVLFATGYQANVGLLQSLGELSPTFYSDAANHASLIDGLSLARRKGATMHVYAHGGVPEKVSGRVPLVVTDGLFSMGGDIADLPGLHDCGAPLIVDDAHGLGTLGDSGRGAAELTGVRPEILVGTLSKAFGSEGGFVCCDKELGMYLRNHARSYVYSTALSAGVVAASLTALRLIQESDVVAILHSNIEYARTALDASKAGPMTPIIPVTIGDERNAVRVADFLREHGVWAPAMRYPTVPRGEAIIRVTVSAAHTHSQIDRLAELLRTATTPRR